MSIVDFTAALDSAESIAYETERPEFPVDALPTVLKEYVTEISKVYNAPLDIPALMGLATISGAAADRYVVTGATKYRPSRVNIYCMIGAPSSTVKSVCSEIVDPMKELSIEVEKHFRDTHQHQLEIQLESLRGKEVESSIETRRKISEFERQLEATPSLRFGSGSTQSLFKAMSRNGGRLFQYDTDAGLTLKVIEGRYQKDNGGDYDAILKAWSGDSFQNNTIRGGRDSVDQPCLATLWIAQPHLIRGALSNPEAVNRGLPSRMLMTCHDSIPFVPETGDEKPVDPLVIASWRDRIRKIAMKADEAMEGQPCEEPWEIVSEPGAIDRFRDFHNHCGERMKIVTEGERQILARAREQAIRLAGLIAIADHHAGNPNSLDENQARRAIEIVSWVQDGMTEAVRKGAAHNLERKATELADYLREREGEVTIAKLKDSRFTEHDVRELARAFPDRFVIETTQIGNGRPSRGRIRLSQ